MILNYDDSMLEDVTNIWNNCNKQNILIKTRTKEEFNDLFIKNEHYKKELNIVYKIDEKIVAFGFASISNDESINKGFITAIAVDKKYQRQGIGSKILKHLEDVIKSFNKSIISISFYNPTKIEWMVPNTKYTHGNLPGVSINSDFYFLLLANKYEHYGDIQDAYFCNLENYKMPDKVIDQIKINESNGYNIVYYDKNKHTYEKQFFEDLNHMSWYNSFITNKNRLSPFPTLIVEKDNEMLGWIGNIFTDKNLRGNFAGVGVSPKVQGIGLGKTLFTSLLNESYKNGAKFMTLFTGSKNPARFIYKSAGFKVVQSFIMIQKEINSN